MKGKERIELLNESNSTFSKDVLEILGIPSLAKFNLNNRMYTRREIIKQIPKPDIKLFQSKFVSIPLSMDLQSKLEF